MIALSNEQDKITAEKQANPTQLPKPLKDDPNLYRNKHGKALLAADRILAILEDEERARRRATQQAQKTYNENLEINIEMVTEIVAERQQQRAKVDAQKAT